jgi:hypothetical protein
LVDQGKQHEDDWTRYEADAETEYMSSLLIYRPRYLDAIIPTSRWTKLATSMFERHQQRENSSAFGRGRKGLARSTALSGKRRNGKKEPTRKKAAPPIRCCGSRLSRARPDEVGCEMICQSSEATTWMAPALSRQPHHNTGGSSPARPSPSHGHTSRWTPRFYFRCTSYLQFVVGELASLSLGVART